jgi:hypothetical protein
MTSTSRRAEDGAGPLPTHGTRLLTGLLVAVTLALAVPAVASARDDGETTLIGGQPTTRAGTGASAGDDGATGLLGGQPAAPAGANVGNAIGVGDTGGCGTAGFPAC